MSTRDPMTVLERIKPTAAVADAWPPADRAAALERVLAATATNPPAVPRPSVRRRVLVTAALTAVLVPSGVGVAAAGGVLPESFVRELSWWTAETDGGVDVQTARRVAQAPGPDGRVLSVWAATGKDGTVCMSPMFEAPGALDRPAPADFHLAGGECPTADQQQGQPFGTVSGSADDRGIHTMWGPAGKAVRADLLLPDGTVRAAVPAQGQFFLWYLADRRVDSPVLVGYDSAGHVVARRQLPNLVAQRHIGG